LISFDISSVGVASQGGNTYWLLVMDHYSNFCWSCFLQHKNDLSKTMMQWLHDFQFRLGFKVKRMNCDNSGENRQFQKDLDRLPHHVKFEFTAPNTPQQNES
jgi:hypothetical protein